METKEARVLQGKILAQEIQGSILETLQSIKDRGRETPCLRAIQVGEDPSAAWYLAQQEKLAGKLGVRYEWVKPETVKGQKALEDEIRKASSAKKVHGIFITMPLPQGFDPDKALLKLDPRKDIEGIHPANLGLIVLRRAKLIPSTALAAFRLIESTGVSLRGKQAVLIGQSAITGRPLQLLLGENRVTTIVCNTGTPEKDIQRFVGESDIVIACAGKPKMIRGRWVKPGSIVIDIGTTEVDGKWVGDIEYEEARKRAGFITPVPGGVGPLTVTMLYQNLMTAYAWQHN
ncbi:MAG: bifunctional 5,10-methylenetetrahydrofolate dehydrogenase/5,10-methenyltetrahydrofolate cyclohydrolase [Candidatus Omnitrophica bacterium]|nr:bifunctional 5,10-methylenetetrahydrofolate dehydrogenase/5,10-methenyltetrahydrofolate cyclohydrolase [Candidatus Omnitrophota bacterium]